MQSYLLGIQYTELIPEVLYCVCAVLLFNKLPRSGKAWAKLAGEAVLLFCAKVLVNAVLVQVPFIGPVLDSFGTVYLLNPLVLFLLGKCLHKLRAATRLVSGVVFSCLYIMCMGFVPSFLIEFCNASYAAVGEYPLNHILLIAILLIAVFLLKRFSVEDIAALSYNYIVLVIFVSVAAAVVSPIFIELYAGSAELAPFCVAYHLFAIILTLTVYMIFYRGSREYNDLIAAAVISQKQQAESRMLEITENNLTEIRKFRHDIKNHYAVMQELLHDKDYDKLQAYFDHLAAHTNVFTTIQTGNRAMDAILNTKAAEAAARSVTLEAKCAVPPELPIEDTKLCSLLFNLLDNAIEAAAASDPKAVEISLLRKESLLLLRVRNTIAPDAAVRHLPLHTTKPDKAAHGYGVQIIRQIVAEYNGTFQYASEDGWFTAEIMLTLEDGRKEAAHG